MFLQNESHFCLRDLNIGIPLFLLSLSKEVLKKASSATKSVVVVVVVRLSLLPFDDVVVPLCARVCSLSLSLSLFREKWKKKVKRDSISLFFFVKTSSYIP